MGFLASPGKVHLKKALAKRNATAAQKESSEKSTADKQFPPLGMPENPIEELREEIENSPGKRSTQEADVANMLQNKGA